MERDRMRPLAFCIVCAFFVFLGTPVIGYADGLQDLMPGVVKVIAKPPDDREKTGSGFIIQFTSKELFILTAAHVVAGAQYPTVEFFGGQGEKVKAEVQPGSEIGDEDHGLALLIVSEMEKVPEDLMVLGLYQDELKVVTGEPMAVIGLPKIVGDWAVIHGHMIARKGRDLLFDVRIDEGASGGAVIRNRQVVGLVQAIGKVYAQGNPADSIRVFLQGFEINPPAYPTVSDDAPMVFVPAGEFMMGSVEGEGGDDPNEQPQHLVALDDYYIDQYEVTVERYARFLKTTGRTPPRYWDQGNLPQHGQKPVVGIHWEDAHRYCQWVGKRLPTEAEWEKAARGTDKRPYPWGTAKPDSSLANFGQSESKQFYEDRLTPVDTYESGKSPYGAYDMAGNVWEWVADWYSEEYYQESTKKNPKGPSSGDRKVMRGGSWDNGARNLRSANRSRKGFPTRRHATLGFRCAKDAP